jgi:hypothetical protein
MASRRRPSSPRALWRAQQRTEALSWDGYERGSARRMRKRPTEAGGVAEERARSSDHVHDHWRRPMDDPGGRRFHRRCRQIWRLSKGLSARTLPAASTSGGDQSVEELKHELAEARDHGTASAEVCRPTKATAQARSAGIGRWRTHARGLRWAKALLLDMRMSTKQGTLPGAHVQGTAVGFRACGTHSQKALRFLGARSRCR